MEKHGQVQLPATSLAPTLTLTVLYLKTFALRLNEHFVMFIKFERAISVHKLAC